MSLDGAITNLASWAGNVMMPTMAGLFFAGAVYRYSKGGQFEQLLYGGFASLMCSGMLRALEGFVQRAGPTSADGFWMATMHGGHVGLLCTAGLLNGVFGQGDDRHIARWRSVKHVTTFVEQDGDAEIIHHRERWANELYLVYADGRTLKLTETPAKKEGEADEECTPAARAA